MKINTSGIALPAWLEIGVIPLLNIVMALFFAGLIMLAIGVNPIEAVGIMINGAFGYDEAVGYTLYYTTNFIFTGLAVAVARRRGASLYWRPRGWTRLPDIGQLFADDFIDTFGHYCRRFVRSCMGVYPCLVTGTSW